MSVEKQLEIIQMVLPTIGIGFALVMLFILAVGDITRTRRRRRNHNDTPIWLSIFFVASVGVVIATALMFAVGMDGLF